MVNKKNIFILIAILIIIIIGLSIYSLIETTKANHCNQQLYLSYVEELESINIKLKENSNLLDTSIKNKQIDTGDMYKAGQNYFDGFVQEYKIHKKLSVLMNKNFDFSPAILKYFSCYISKCILKLPLHDYLNYKKDMHAVIYLDEQEIKRLKIIKEITDDYVNIINNSKNDDLYEYLKNYYLKLNEYKRNTTWDYNTFINEGVIPAF